MGEGFKDMAYNKLETWVIDPDIWRRGCVPSHFIVRGCLTIPMDPTGQIDLIENLNAIYSRPILAVIYEDSDVVDRILDCQYTRPIYCVVYSDSLKAKLAGNLLRQGVGALVDWPCHIEEVADAVVAAAGVPLARRCQSNCTGWR